MCGPSSHLGSCRPFKRGWSKSPDPFLFYSLRLLYSLKADLWGALRYPALTLAQEVEKPID